MKFDENELHENQNTDTFVFAHVVSDIFFLSQLTLSHRHHSFLQIFRHGDRNIEAPYGPNDPYKDEMAHWPGGFGQLTDVRLAFAIVNLHSIKNISISYIFPSL